MVALSFDAAASPTFSLSGFRKRVSQAYGWGFAWYPDDGPAAQLVRDATSVGDNAMTKLLREWERFASTTFVAHLRGATRALDERDTHPFARTFGRRDWVFAHNGDLDVPEGLPGLAEALALGPRPLFQPVGRTDSEHAFCWLLGRAFEDGAESLVDIGWAQLHDWMRTINQLGTANIVLSDGRDLVAYSDQSDFNGLHSVRVVPPEVPSSLLAPDFEIGFEDARDRTRSMVVFSTRPFKDRTFEPLAPGQMVVVRRGAYIYNSHATPEQQRLMVVPRPGRSEAEAPRVPAFIQAPVAQQPAAAEPGLSGTPAPAPPPPAASPQRRTVDLTPTAKASGSFEHHHARAEPGRKLRILHETTYRYDVPVEKSSHAFRLQPLHDTHQDLLEHELEITVDGRVIDYTDVFDNAVTKLDVEQPFSEMVVRATSLVRVRGGIGPAARLPDRRVQIPLVWMPWQRQMMTPYLLPPELPETQLRELSDYAMSFVERQDSDLIQTLLDMNTTIYRDFSYVSGSTTTETTPFQVYVKRKGVCQDFANLLICMARLLNIPARYRVGYIYTGSNYDNQVQSDASHAWAELYLPWNGWQGFDPTNGCLVNVDHVRVACGRNYVDATPTGGTLYKGGQGERLAVRVEVEEAV